MKITYYNVQQPLSNTPLVGVTAILTDGTFIRFTGRYDTDARRWATSTWTHDTPDGEPIPMPTHPNPRSPSQASFKAALVGWESVAQRRRAAAAIERAKAELAEMMAAEEVGS